MGSLSPLLSPWLALSFLILGVYVVNAQSTFSENLQITLTAGAGMAEMTGIQITIPEQVETVTQMQMITVTQMQMQTVTMTVSGNCAVATSAPSDEANVQSSPITVTEGTVGISASQSTAQASISASSTALPAETSNSSQAMPEVAGDPAVTEKALNCPCTCMCPAAAFRMMVGNASTAAATSVIESMTTMKTVMSTVETSQGTAPAAAVTGATTTILNEQPISSTENSSASGSIISTSIDAQAAAPSISASSMAPSTSSLVSSTSQNADAQIASTESSVSFDIRTFSLLSAVTVPLSFPTAG